MNNVQCTLSMLGPRQFRVLMSRDDRTVAVELDLAGKDRAEQLMYIIDQTIKGYSALMSVPSTQTTENQGEEQ